MPPGACYLLKRNHAVRANRAEVHDVAGAVQAQIRAAYGDCNGGKADVLPLVSNREFSDCISLIAVIVPEEKSALRTFVEAYPDIIYAVSHSRRKPVGENMVDYLFAHRPAVGRN